MNTCGVAQLQQSCGTWARRFERVTYTLIANV